MYLCVNPMINITVNHYLFVFRLIDHNDSPIVLFFMTDAFRFSRQGRQVVKHLHLGDAYFYQFVINDENMQAPTRQAIPNNATFKTITALVEPVLAGLSAIANVTVLIAFARCRQLRKRNSNVLLVFLATADLLHVVLTVPISFATQRGYPHNYYGCMFVVCTATLALQLTIPTLFIIAIDRFIAVRWPFRHPEICSRSRIIKCIVLLWVIGACFIYLPMFGWNLGWINDEKCSFHRLVDKRFRIYAIFFPASLAPLLAMYCIYAYIFYKVLKMSRTVGPETLTEPSADEFRRKAFVAAKKCGVIILAYIFFILPVDIMNCCHLWLGFICVACTRIATWGLLIHGIVCPVIYLFQNKLLRAVVMLTVRLQPIDEHALSLIDS